MSLNHPHLHSIQNEMAVICCCIIDPLYALPICISNGINSSVFYKQTHQMIWDSIMNLQERGTDIDEITLCDDLQASGNLEQVGNHQQLTRISGVVETSASIHSYIEIVRRCYVHRKVVRHAQALLENALKPADSLKSIKENIQSDLSELNGVSVQEKDESLREVADRMVDQAEREFRGEKDAVDDSRWVKWGMPTIDESFGPLNPDRRDNLVVIAGRPGEGKTALCNNIALPSVLDDKIVVKFTLETTREDDLRQMASIHAQINTRFSFEELKQDLRYKEENVVKYIRTLKSLREKCDKTLFIFEDDMELDSIESRIREIKARVGRIDLIVVDYLQLVEVNDKNLVREQQVAKVSRRFKLIAKEMNLPLILAAQLNRDYNEKEGPALKNLRESGAIEQDADRVIFTWRPKQDANGNEQMNRNQFQQKITQAKMKNGPRLWKWVVFKPSTTTFQDVPPEENRGRPKGS